ncbi:MAG: hypothetical protein LUD82_06700 [Clostridiales bacterium]|nr:hypothetical protein [Clostridiales bacterium]
MYNRYIPNEEFIPVEDSAPEQSGGPTPKQTGEGLGGLLGRLLGGGGLPRLFQGDGSRPGVGLLESPGLGKLDKGDILLLLVLIYLFKESEDDEWLIILALVLLMGL